MKKYLQHVLFICLCLTPVFVVAQSSNSNVGDTSINYTYVTIPKKYIYPVDTPIGKLELELYDKTPTSTIIGKTFWYGAKFHGRKMANGEKFDMNNPIIVASRDLKFGTKLKITNLKNNKVIYGIVKDRGPYTYKWVIDKNGKKVKKYLAEIDISYAGAKLLEISGTGDVKIEVY